MPGYSAEERKKEKKERPHWLLKNVSHSHFLWMGWRASLPSMWPINIFSWIFAMLQPRSNTESLHEWSVSGLQVNSEFKTWHDPSCQKWTPMPGQSPVKEKPHSPPLTSTASHSVLSWMNIFMNYYSVYKLSTNSELNTWHAQFYLKWAHMPEQIPVKQPPPPPNSITDNNCQNHSLLG